MAHLQSSMCLTMIYKQKIKSKSVPIMLTKIIKFLKKRSFQLVLKTDYRYSLGILNVLR